LFGDLHVEKYEEKQKIVEQIQNTGYFWVRQGASILLTIPNISKSEKKEKNDYIT
jgi:hypothetical protein